MHRWYMEDGRRSLASVARQFSEDEETVRRLFTDEGLELKTAQPLRGAAAKNRAKAQTVGKQPAEPTPASVPEELVDEPGLVNGRDVTPMADTLVRALIDNIDAEVGKLEEARSVLAQLIGGE